MQHGIRTNHSSNYVRSDELSTQFHPLTPQNTSYPGSVDEHHPKSAAESTVDSTNTHSVVKLDYVDCTVSVRTKNCGVWKIPDFERGRGGVGKENSLGRFQSVLDDL